MGDSETRGEEIMKYRRKPVVVDAFQMTERNRWNRKTWPQWLEEAWQMDHRKIGAFWSLNNAYDFFIRTLKGAERITYNDWITCGTKSELNLCKPDIFEEIYEVVEEQPMSDEFSARPPAPYPAQVRISDAVDHKFQLDQEVWWLNTTLWQIELVLIRCYNHLSYGDWEIEPVDKNIQVVPEDELFLNRADAYEEGAARLGDEIKSFSMKLDESLMIQRKFIEKARRNNDRSYVA